MIRLVHSSGKSVYTYLSMEQNAEVYKKDIFLTLMGKILTFFAGSATEPIIQDERMDGR